MSPFRMGSLDPIHLMVPDRYEVARGYAQNLGFEIQNPGGDLRIQH